MSTYTVIACDNKGTKQTTWGMKKTLQLVLRDEMGQTKIAEWFTNATTPEPALESKLEGSVAPATDREGNVKPEWGLKFKPESAGGGGGWKPRTESPELGRRIVRQHSQEMTLRLFALTGSLQGAQLDTLAETNPELLRQLQKTLRRWFDWFDADVESAVKAGRDTAYGEQQRASEVRRDVERTGRSDVPDDGTPRVSTMIQDDDVPF